MVGAPHIASDDLVAHKGHLSLNFKTNGLCGFSLLKRIFVCFGHLTF